MLTARLLLIVVIIIVAVIRYCNVRVYLWHAIERTLRLLVSA